MKSLPGKLLLCFCFCLSAVAARAQYRFDHWTVNEGLPQNSVYAIAQTPDGYLWMTTFDGLVRFDGVRFTVFNKANLRALPTNRFISLLAETDGTLWAGTETDGLVRYQTGQIQNFTISDGLPADLVLQIQKDLDDSLLFITVNGLARWRQGQLKTEWQKDYRGNKIYVSPRGSRWELDSHGLRKIGRDGAQLQFPLPFDINKIAFDYFFSFLSYVPMYEDPDGALWLAASGNLYKLKDGSVTVLTAREGMPQSLVRDIEQDAEGKIWVGTDKDGACQLNENHFFCYDKSKGLSSNFVRDMFLDREGTLWITTDEGGINRLTKQVVRPLSVPEGLVNKNIYPIYRDRTNNIWIGSVQGLSQFRDGKFKNYTLGKPLVYENITAIKEDSQGRLWLGADGGVQYLENGRVTEFTGQLGFKVGEAKFVDIHEDRQGIIWFGTNRGLIKFQDGQVKLITAKDGLPSNEIKFIYERQDGTLVLGMYGGLAILRNGEVTNTITEKDGLAGNFVRSVFEDADGILWIGTYDSGLSRFKDGKFTNYNTTNGLFSNGVFAIQEDSRGNFWMSGNQGIYRVKQQELNDFADGKISKITSTAYGKSDGMLNIECNGGGQPSSLKLPDGKLWFPTQDGVAMIDPEAVPFNPNPPPVVIESAVLSGTTVDLKDKLEVQPSQNNLQIRYTGLSFIKPEQTRFRYKLEGLDENWNEAGPRREAFYHYLPPGKYTFRVIAANSDNVWNEQGATLEIVVHPAFYQTWWFLILAVLTFAALVFLFYSRRLAEVHRRQAAQEEFSRQLINAHETERRRIAAELHDSLGQHLAMIRNSAIFGEQTAQGLDEAKTRFGNISEQTMLAITEVREISHNLRPYLLDRLGLTKAVKALLEKIEDNSKLEINSRIESVDGIFAGETEIGIYRIIQESINNILKHSEATEIEVLIEKGERFVTIKITDNGKGFEVQNDKRGGFGLLGMRERVKMLGGTISIDSELQKGTSILIKLDVIVNDKTIWNWGPN